MQCMLEGSTYPAEFDYSNEPYKDIDKVHKHNISNQHRLNDLKKIYTSNDFVYPLNYIYEFIEYSFEVIEIENKKYVLTVRLSDVSQ